MKKSDVGLDIYSAILFYSNWLFPYNFVRLFEDVNSLLHFGWRPKRVIGKQCIPRSDAANEGIHCLQII